MAKSKQIKVQGSSVNLSLVKDSDDIYIADMANGKDRSVRVADIKKIG